MKTFAIVICNDVIVNIVIAFFQFHALIKISLFKKVADLAITKREKVLTQKLILPPSNVRTFFFF